MGQESGLLIHFLDQRFLLIANPKEKIIEVGEYAKWLHSGVFLVLIVGLGGVFFGEEVPLVDDFTRLWYDSFHERHADVQYDHQEEQVHQITLAVLISEDENEEIVEIHCMFHLFIIYSIKMWISFDDYYYNFCTFYLI